MTACYYRLYIICDKTNYINISSPFAGVAAVVRDARRKVLLYRNSKFTPSRERHRIALDRSQQQNVRGEVNKT